MQFYGKKFEKGFIVHYPILHIVPCLVSTILGPVTNNSVHSNGCAFEIGVQITQKWTRKKRDAFMVFPYAFFQNGSDVIFKDTFTIRM